VRGPAIYGDLLPHARVGFQDTIYTASGMTAISALLTALTRFTARAYVLALPGSYSETVELIERYGGCLHLLRLDHMEELEAKREKLGDALRILVVDSCLPSQSFRSMLASRPDDFDLILFDTTGFWTRSARIRRVMAWVDQVPVVLVRSHTKLDSLGVEYGRLGSAMFVCSDSRSAAHKVSVEQLANEFRDALRLCGGAPVPAHFPPYIGSRAYYDLGQKRLATILRNTRQVVRHVSRTDGIRGQLDFAHHVYITLVPSKIMDEREAKQMADALCSDLRRVGLPFHHAGSFGFDFATAEWFRDTIRDRDVVRIAVPDLPTAVWDQLAREITRWWLANDGPTAWARAVEECTASSKRASARRAEWTQTDGLAEVHS
jgi:hypothetical protein